MLVKIKLICTHCRTSQKSSPRACFTTCSYK